MRAQYSAAAQNANPASIKTSLATSMALLQGLQQTATGRFGSGLGLGLGGGVGRVPTDSLPGSLTRNSDLARRLLGSGGPLPMSGRAGMGDSIGN